MPKSRGKTTLVVSQTRCTAWIENRKAAKTTLKSSYRSYHLRSLRTSFGNIECGPGGNRNRVPAMRMPYIATIRRAHFNRIILSKMDKIFEGLNDKQVEAVRAIEGPVLVISGPGSGKTRCLTHRIAYLIEQGIKPESILAITFTNKAASEMRERISRILNQELGIENSDHNSKFLIRNSSPLIGTFHSICLRILRREISVLGY